MANKIDRVPVREQDPKVRAKNFDEVCFGYDAQEAQLEASRCLNCKKPRCVEACPVGIKIPVFVSQVLSGNFHAAYETISQDSSLPAICGRVCPQETQCEESCILGVKGEPVSIGKLERFVADYEREQGAAGLEGAAVVAGSEGITGVAGTMGVEGGVGMENAAVMENAAGMNGAAVVAGSEGVTGVAGTMGVEGGVGMEAATRAAEMEAAGRVAGALDGVVGVGNGIKVAVVGSGPAGLACASDLAKLAYNLTIFESLHKPGGVLTYGIPEFRLPKKAVVEKEIQKLLDMGIHIETDVFVGRTVTIDELMDKEGFKAVFVGTGAGLPLFLGIPGENINGVFSANEYLTRNNLMQAFSKDSDTPIFRAKKVCVVGGGNVAMDAARTALRLGAEVTIVYRRGEKELPARAEEVHHAKEEGINFQLLTNPVEVLSDDKGWVRGIRCIRMELGEPDASGRRSPIPIQGSEFDIEADALIVALGTKINRLIADTTPGLDTDRKGRLLTSDTATSRPGVFAGGDVVTGAATVILAMGEGRKAAAAIHRYLCGE